MSSLQNLYLLLAVSLLASFSRWGTRLTYPLRIFSTWVHECAHATLATLLGGSSVRITLSSDGSGLARFKMAPSRLRQAVIASSGYLGTTIVGCALLYLAERRTWGSFTWDSRKTLVLLAVLTGLSLLVWIRNGFGWFAVLALTCAFAVLSQYPPLAHYSKNILLFLGIQTALHSLFDLRNLYRTGNSTATESDAQTLQRLLFLPAGFWATLWLGTSLVVLYLTARALALIPKIV